MAHSVRFEITAPFQLGDLVAEVTLEGGGQVNLVLRGGVFDGELPARARRLRLTLGEAPDGSTLAPERSDLPAREAPRGAVVPLETLFDAGVAVPDDGKVAVQIAWGMPCHAEPPPESTTDRTRFGSWEHILTAEWVGQGQDGLPLSFNGVVADLKMDTPLAVGNKNLSFGQIIALAGDYFAHLDDKAAKTPEIAQAWPKIGGALGWVAGDYQEMTLAAESRKATDALVAAIFRHRDAHESGAGEIVSGAVDALFRDYPLRRYGALASQNFCHFGSQPPDGSIDDARNDGLQMYRHYHRRALDEAAIAGAEQDGAALLQAFVVDAFACHFLTDLFSSGHIRVPRRAIAGALGILKGGKASKELHDEDNEGLWVRMRNNPPGKQRVVWRAFGDNFLRTKDGAQHLMMVREAVRRSVEEVFAKFARATPGALAEDLLPVALAAGKGPQAGDIEPDADILGIAHAVTRWPDGPPQPNGFPLYALSKTGTLGKRDGAGPTYSQILGQGRFTLGDGA